MLRALGRCSVRFPGSPAPNMATSHSTSHSRGRTSSLSAFLLFLTFLTTPILAFYKGVDWSSAIVEESSGRIYKTAAGVVKPLESIFAESAVNIVRQRVWVNPSDGNYNLAYNLKLARRAKSAGLDVYIDLFYSDTWADGDHQPTPAGWPSDIDNLSWKVYNYTLDVCNALAAAGISPKIISIGNEIRHGLLWPAGTVDHWGNIARLLHSASSGVRYSALGNGPKIMVHTDNGWDWPAQKSFFTNLLAQGSFTAADFDMIGLSYYPFYGPSATLANLKTSLTNLATTWHKSLAVVEINWPTSCPSPKYPFPRDLANIPISVEGQVTFVKTVANIVKGVAGGVGVFYWEPAWVDNSALGSSCPYNTMFAWPGTALASLDVFKSL
ncbi:glycoside hydrolase family 53 protein [Gonapodya prolifera JEL478]|uniref:Arabinogalactan endo-beta-1,4-galactanase n=1 Tax=Gonapodya prolifera (strain JEL478) TaxID=1344416 RepID=A0A139A9B1_GONPJ|nr:glycoside hydrolase family 53 protein [Gonapodya prolifera JEL478]|eukprot:KXS13356.1 glycoside hydrolase family 53 protein [Gonapodya prolifera JEL478]